jgi:hypothetical protein
VTFSACKTGLRARKRAFSGLGLDLVASQFDGLASLFARLAEKRACTYFSAPKAYLINMSGYTVQRWCVLTGLAILSGGFAHGCHDTALPPKTTQGNIVNSSQNYGLAGPSTLGQYTVSQSKKYPKFSVLRFWTAGFSMIYYYGQLIRHLAM